MKLNLISRVLEFLVISSDFKIVPFFTYHSLHGAKALDFVDFCKGLRIDIMNSKGHLTEAGLAQLKELYLNMNSNERSSVLILTSLRFINCLYLGISLIHSLSFIQAGTVGTLLVCTVTFTLCKVLSV